VTRQTIDLTREAWLTAGQALLRRDGLRALRLRPLAASLNISTGSFYHHFKDFETYLGQLADYYSGEQLTANLVRIRQSVASPAECIRRASELALSEDLPRLALAMRAWARSDERALTAVRSLDQTLIDFFQECLLAMGFDAREAATRAYLLIASSTADVEPPASLERGESLRDRVLAIICAPAVPPKPPRRGRASGG